MATDYELTSEVEVRMPSTGVHLFAHGVLRRVRSERGLTIRDLSLLLDVSAQAATAWEQGRSTPSPGHLRSLAEVLRISTDDLLRTPLNEADLASLRERAGLSATEVARSVGVHRSALSEIERGYRKLPNQLRSQLAVLYGREPAMITDAWQRGREAATRRAAK
ncbi:MAG TPA: helix-turn-helix transcriptional regulator [Jatrophihabitans sp.]|jgi:transcriptional regulator with XRE-family HTH domain|nr:helix-turn-helix transcriptional regulator [Jatrophihabitans sp.]